MSNNIHVLQSIMILNRAFMAYFLNEAEKLGVDFYNTRPTEDITKRMIGHSFVYDVEYPHMKGFEMFKIPMFDIAIEDLSVSGLEKFFSDDLKSKLNIIAKEFAETAKNYPDSDYIFSNLPDAVPLYNSFDRCGETNFSSRMIYGHNLANNQKSILFEFYCLFVDRWRRVEDDPIYGIKCQRVDSMTPEDRIKYDKQPQKEYDE